VKLLDMARNFNSARRLYPDVEIPIAFVGLRPGEKLREELVGRGRAARALRVEKIQRVQLACLPQLAFLTQAISELERLAIAGKSREVIELLGEAVPTFQPGTGEYRDGNEFW